MFQSLLGSIVYNTTILHVYADIMTNQNSRFSNVHNYKYAFIAKIHTALENYNVMKTKSIQQTIRSHFK